LVVIAIAPMIAKNLRYKIRQAAFWTNPQ
jgi:hypothetical protein